MGRNKISDSLKIGRNTVSDYLGRIAICGVKDYESIAGLDEMELERRLGFWQTPSKTKREPERALPDFGRIHEERKRDGVTLYLLWQEYLESNPEGYRYSQFADYYRKWRRKLSLVMRQVHRAGDKSFVDYCDGLFVTNPVTGEKQKTQLFVGVLGASSYTFAEATFTQALPDWLMSHVRMFEFFGGVSQAVVPDNLKSGVSKPCFYEPVINLSYQDLVEHYGTCVLPAKVRSPKYKAKAEVAVLVAQRWILAALRDRTFYSLAELNVAIGALLEKLNNRTMRHLGKSRRELFESLDRPALKALPATRYEFAEWKTARVNIDYHVEFDHHCYSVPYALVQQESKIRATAQTVEIFIKGKRVASHPRSFVRGKYSTEPSHRPASHKLYAEWTPSRMVSWGNSIGDAVGTLIERMLKDKPHPEQGFRSALGIIRLADKYGAERLTKAAHKALAMNSPAYQTVKSMLKTGMEDVPLERTQPATQDCLVSNKNVRGKGYYH
jgi:transposase